MYVCSMYVLEMFTSIRFRETHNSDIPRAHETRRQQKNSLITENKLIAIKIFLGVKTFPNVAYIEKVIKLRMLSNEVKQA